MFLKSPCPHGACWQLCQPVVCIRLLQLDGRGRLFGVSFAGEDGLDWGGLYREAVTGMVEDCFSPRLDLLLPCPNNVKQQVRILPFCHVCLHSQVIEFLTISLLHTVYEVEVSVSCPRCGCSVVYVNVSVMDLCEYLCTYRLYSCG